LYQKEVDRLTSRAKFSEQAYMGVYGQVTKAPDHGAALEKADEWADRTRRSSKLEIENQKLNRELEEFRRDFEEIRNQEVTVRRLEDQIRRYEEDMERTIEQRVSDAERRMNDEMAAKVIIQKEREDELMLQTQKALEDAKLAQQNLEVMQNQKSATESRLGTIELLEVALSLALMTLGCLEAELQAKQASIDMLTNDLDRMATVVATLEKDVVRPLFFLHTATLVSHPQRSVIR
jgi:homeobox protein cut-like